MKKILSVLLAASLVFGVSGSLFPHEADAKRSYSSGTKSFQPSTKSPQQGTNSNISKPDANKANNPVNQAPAAASKGSMMKGLLMGGMAGLLLGGLFSHLGAFGPMLGLLLNVLCVVVVVMLARKLYVSFKKQRKSKENPSWRS